MGRPHDHQYLDAGSSSCGAMKCGGCGKPIVTGQYRAYKRSKAHDWAFVTHHRACCADDAGWAEFDGALDATKTRNASFLAEAIAFRDKWNIGDLDDLIDGLEVQAAKAAPATGEASSAICTWCSEAIRPGEPTGVSDGERMHLHCAAEEMDNATFDRDFGG